MVKFERRIHNRQPCDLPILFCMEESQDFQNARLFNISLNGMSFECHAFIEPGAKLRIKSEGPSSSPYDMEYVIATDKVYQAVVRWCSELKNDRQGLPNYLVGVMLSEPLGTVKIV